MITKDKRAKAIEILKTNLENALYTYQVYGVPQNIIDHYGNHMISPSLSNERELFFQ